MLDEAETAVRCSRTRVELNHSTERGVRFGQSSANDHESAEYSAITLPSSNAPEFAISVAEVQMCRRPSGRRALHALRELERLLEQRNSLFQLPRMNRHDSQLICRQRIFVTNVFGRLEILFRQVDVHQAEVLHADEEQREVRALQVTKSSRVGRDGLIVFPFERVRVSKGEPGRSKARVDENRFSTGAESAVDEGSREYSDKRTQRTAVTLPIVVQQSTTVQQHTN